MASVPTLIQHVVWSSNWQVDFGNDFRLVLPNATLFQNCLIFKFLYPTSVKWIRITDNMGNQWPLTPTMSVDDTTNNVRLAVYIMPAMPAGVQTLFVNFNAAIQGFNPAFQEWAGFALSNILDGTPQTTFNQPNPIAAAALTTSVANSAVFQIAQSTDSGTAASGFGNGFHIFNVPTGTFIQTDPQNAGYYCQYQIQATPGSVTPSANVVPAPGGAYGFAIIAFALKTADTGTLPSPVGTRVIGSFHLRIAGSGAPGNQNYAIQWPTFGNLLVGGATDPSSVIRLVGATGNVSGIWANVPDGGNASLIYKTNAINSTAEVLSVTLNDGAAHNYVQGVWWDFYQGGAFDVANNTGGGVTFGPGNSTPPAPIVPQIAEGVTVVYWGLNTGPPDAIESPANAYMASVFYSGENDLTDMDNGDMNAIYIFNSNTVQNWVLHNTATTTGYGFVAATFGGTLQPQAPFKYFANGAFQANSFVEGGLNTNQIVKMFANTQAQINSMVEVATPVSTKHFANGEVQSTQFLEFMY